MKNRIKFTALILSGIFALICLLVSCSGAATPEAPVAFYTVTFDSDGGSSVEAQSIENGKKAAIPENPVKNGYNFLGWYINDIYFDFTNEISADIQLKAKWSPIYYTVSFYSDDGSYLSSQSIQANTRVTKPEDPEKEGYEFIGWYIGESSYDFSTPVTYSFWIEAKWKNITSTDDQKDDQTEDQTDDQTDPQNIDSPANTFFTVTFNSNGISNTPSQTIKSGEKATKPVNPIKDGYTFMGWYLGQSLYDFSSAVTSDIVLEGKWELIPPKTYTVTFAFENGGMIKR